VIKIKGTRADYADPARGDASGKETTSDERVQIIALWDKACLKWKVNFISFQANQWGLCIWVFCDCISILVRLNV